MAQSMDYGAMLTEAQGALDELSRFTDQKTQLTDQLTKMEQDLEAEEKAVRTAVESAAGERRADLEESFDSEIETLQGRLEREQNSRERARTLGMEERIRTETAGISEETQSLENRLKTLYKAQKVPFICRTNFYYAMYFPRTFKEILTFILVFAIFFAAIPLGTWYFLLPERKTLYLVLIYLGVILVFGGLYLVIGNVTKGKHLPALREAMNLRRQIRINRRKEKAVIASIRGERDDKAYHLEAFDAEIADIEHDLGEITARKKEALANFEKETRKTIEDEIAGESREKITRLTEQINEFRGRVNYTEKVIKDKKIDIADRYESYVGREFMTKEKLEELRRIIESGEAANISEAREVYYTKNGAKRR